ncbi:hypothetical protein [Streptomyces sp. 8N616]|uniref:hypothetical protein n=1 Tax=Streptomyces sp. 8N616 TaxID=3457414 RepID=UPI003FCFA767
MRLDKMLTEARARMSWLREGSSVPQQQLIRDFSKPRWRRPSPPAGPDSCLAGIFLWAVWQFEGSIETCVLRCAGSY